jgi:hypothetical protein
MKEYHDEGCPIFNTNESWVHVKWVPCNHGMAHPQAVNGGDSLQIRRAAANIVNKQSQIASKRWSFGMALTTPRHKKQLCYKM